MKRGGPVQNRMFLTLAPFAGRIILRLLYGSLRLTEEGTANISAARKMSKNGNVIFASWHSHLVILAYHLRGKNIHLLISRHRDGQLITSILEKLGYSAARGSSTRGGVAGLFGMVKGAADTDLGITPDGPRGPAGQVKQGIAALAKITGMPVIPLGYSATKYWRLSSWDRHVVPKPGSACRIRYGTPVKYEGNSASFTDSLTSELAKVSILEPNPENSENPTFVNQSRNCDHSLRTRPQPERITGGGGKMLLHQTPSSRTLRPVLLPLSMLYGAAAALRYFSFRAVIPGAKRLPVPVVSVGSLKAGGTGKTPLIAELARFLLKNGLKPAILSRGYGGRSSGTNPVVLSDGDQLCISQEEAGDEPWMLAVNNRGVPLILGKDRYAAGLVAVERFNVDVMLLDDGFQHYRLKRNLDILVHGAPLEITDGNLLPAGFLREPPAAAGRADMVVFTGLEKSGEGRSFLGKPVFNGARKLHGMIRNPGEVSDSLFISKESGIAVLTGIAGAERFMYDLRQNGYAPIVHFEYPDHFPFTSRDIDRISQIAKAKGAEFIITTEKDLVRITGFESRLPVLAVTMRVEMPSSFYQSVLDCIGEYEIADQQE